VATPELKRERGKEGACSEREREEKPKEASPKKAKDSKRRENGP